MLTGAKLLNEMNTIKSFYTFFIKTRITHMTLCSNLLHFIMAYAICKKFLIKFCLVLAMFLSVTLCNNLSQG